MRKPMTDKKYLILNAQAGILAHAPALASNFPTAYCTKDGFGHDHGNIMVVISRMHKALALLEEAGVLKRQVPRDESLEQLRVLNKALSVWGVALEDEMFEAQARAEAAEAKVKELEARLADTCFSQVGICTKCDFCLTSDKKEDLAGTKTKNLDEVKVPSPTTKWENMVQVHGDTYTVRRKLRALGGIWHYKSHLWYLPMDTAVEAQRIVDSVYYDSELDYDHYDGFDPDYYDDPAGDHT